MAKKSTKGTRGSRKRRGKGESDTGAKDGQVEVRQAAGIGDNSKLALAAPDDYSHHMKSIKGLAEKAATANSMLRHAKTSANKCSPGLAASIAETLAIERENDPIKLQRRLEHLGLGMKLIGSSVQLSVFDTLAGEVAEQAYKRGFADGEAPRTAACPYPENSDLAEKYSKGWRHGTAKNMGMTPEDSDAAMMTEDGDKIAAE